MVAALKAEHPKLHATIIAAVHFAMARVGDKP